MSVAPHTLRVLVFDVFGTCTDWRGSIIRAGRALRPDADWSTIADQWRREGYIDPIRRIVAGERGYVSSDVLFREMLDVLDGRHALGLAPDQREQLALAWRRLAAWPDVAEGLSRLRRRFTIAPLSNGSFATLTWMARSAGMPWDCILSTDLVQTFKPDREAYLLPSRLLDVPTEQVMLVAAHVDDLRAAQAVGLRTALVHRPLEWGADAAPPQPADHSFDFGARDFVDLAAQLGA
jgi:2-haloacid dehalogenase